MENRQQVFEGRQRKTRDITEGNNYKQLETQMTMRVKIPCTYHIKLIYKKKDLHGFLWLLITPYKFQSLIRMELILCENGNFKEYF